MNNDIMIEISWGNKKVRTIDNGETSNLDVRISIPIECIDARHSGETSRWFAEIRATLATYRSHTKFPFIDGDVFIKFNMTPGDPVDERWGKTMNGEFVNDWVKVLMFHNNDGLYNVTYKVHYNGQIEPLMVRRINRE